MTKDHGFTFKNWTQFRELVDALDKETPPSATSYIFRGQGDAWWRLSHTLFRALTNDERLHLPAPELALDLERTATEEFRAEAHTYIPTSVLSATKVNVDWWCLMQHHDAPTRLIDWTTSPYVAAYFAAASRGDKDGALYAVHEPSLSQAMLKLYGEAYNKSPRQDLNGINAFYSDPHAPETIAIIYKRTKTDRMINQQGLFTMSRNILANQEEVITRALATLDNTKVLYGKFIIPADLKSVFLKKLYAMNITAQTLFPGIDGVGRSVDEMIRIMRAVGGMATGTASSS